MRLQIRRLLYFVSVACVGCHGPRSRIIAAIPRDASSAYCVTEHAGLSETAAKHGLSVYWNGPQGENGSEQQVVLIQRAIDRGDAGIVLTPTAPFALDTMIHRALAQKIPVVILGPAISLPSDANLSFVLNDVQRSGELAAERIGRIVPASGKIAMVGIDPMSPGSKELAAAFEGALAHVAPGVKIVSRLVGPLTFGQAEMELERTMEEHPDLAAIYALTVPATRGAVAALRTFHREKVIKVVGTDQTVVLLYLLRQGVVDSLIIQNMRAMGMTAVENIVSAREVRSTQPVTYFEPLLLTIENIDTEPVQQILKMDWRPRG